MDQQGTQQTSIRQSQDTRPVPDPTVLTTEASNRLEATLRNLIQAEVAHQDELFVERLEGVRLKLEERMTGNARQFGEKLAKIETQFDMLNARTAEQKKDTKDALDAALAAQKEAVASQTASSEKSITKSETATIERIKAVETLLSASTKASDDKLNDLKDRIVAIESIKLGTTEGVASARSGTGEMRAIIASVIGVALFLVAIASIAIAILKP